MGSESLKRVHPKLLEYARDMRQHPAPAEIKLWCCLRDRRLNGLKFRRQKVAGPFIADFYCAEHRLIIELDGESHGEREEYDANRTIHLERDGYRVIRFLNDDVQKHLDAVLLEILKICGMGEFSPSPQPSPPRGRGSARQAPSPDPA